MKQNFFINPRIIAHFGEDLIKNESIALLELVKNSYDAYATVCSVDFHTENSTPTRITISDNGEGMNYEVIKNVWLVIGTDNKHKQLQSQKGGRYPLGEKGIGRLGVHKLGNKIHLLSKTAQDKEVEVHIDWEQLDTAKSIDDFCIDVFENDEPKCFSEGETGTIIIIENLKTNWDRRQLRDVYRNLVSLNSPFSNGDDSFKVKITSNSNLFQGLPSFEDIIENGGLYFGHCILSGDMIKSFRYEFKPWSSLAKVEKGRTVTGKDLSEEDLYLKGKKFVDGKKRQEFYDIDLNQHKIGDVEFDIIIFETDAAIFNYVNAEKSTIKEYLEENGGIRVYRDNVRVYDYGEKDNDWLGIDLKRVHRVGGNVSNNIILGSVRINRAQSFGLREKTNREGFIEDEAYLAFVDAVNYVLSIVVRFRNEDKNHLATLYKAHKVTEPVLSDLNDVIDIVNKRVSGSNDKQEILKYLYRIDSQYKEVKDVLIKSANAGLNLSVVVHEIEKQVAALVGCAERGEKDRIIDISQRLEKIVRGYTVMIRKSSIGEKSLASIVQTALENYEFRFSDHNITVYSNYKDSKLKAFLAETESVSVLTNLLDNAIFWLTYSRREKPQISVYITDQIAGYNSIVVSDNGPGFNITTEAAVQPFVTGKPHNIGMGLGLHISNEMMAAMKGKLMFLEDEDIEYPKYIIENKINKAVVALCFPKEKK